MSTLHVQKKTKTKNNLHIFSFHSDYTMVVRIQLGNIFLLQYFD